MVDVHDSWVAESTVTCAPAGEPVLLPPVANRYVTPTCGCGILIDPTLYVLDMYMSVT